MWPSWGLHLQYGMQRALKAPHGQLDELIIFLSPVDATIVSPLGIACGIIWSDGDLGPQIRVERRS